MQWITHTFIFLPRVDATTSHEWLRRPPSLRTQPDPHPRPLSSALIHRPPWTCSVTLPGFQTIDQTKGARTETREDGWSGPLPLCLLPSSPRSRPAPVALKSSQPNAFRATAPRVRKEIWDLKDIIFVLIVAFPPWPEAWIGSPVPTYRANGKMVSCTWRLSPPLWHVVGVLFWLQWTRRP